MEGQEAEKRLCVMCGQEEVYRGMERFDKCFSCAMKHRGEMHDKFVACLLPQQVALFNEYDKARTDASSMLILD